MEPIRVHSGESVVLTTSGPWPDIILSGPVRPFRGCYVGACPYYDIDDDTPRGIECDPLAREKTIQEEGLTLVEWIPGVGLVSKKL